MNDTRGDGVASIASGVDTERTTGDAVRPIHTRPDRSDRCRGDPARVRVGVRSAACSAPSTTTQAIATVEHAWDLGIRSFDVAPLYGYGTGERRLGAALRDRPRDEYVLSTKVGRLVVPADRVPPGADIDHQALDGRDDAYYEDVADRRIVFDYSADGVTRSLEESLARLGLDRVDIALHPRSRRPLAGRHRRRLSGPASAARAGRRPRDRRRDQPVADARPVRPRGRDGRVPRRRALHAARPGCARGGPAAVRRARHLRARRRRDEQRGAGRPAAGRSLRLRPGAPRDPRARQAAGRHLRAHGACRCVPPPSSSRWPIPPSPG